MTIKGYLDDEEFGKMLVSVNPRARRFICRLKGSGLVLTVPPRTSLMEAQTAVNRMREGIRKLLAKRDAGPQLPTFSLQSRIDTECFRLRLHSGTRPSMRGYATVDADGVAAFDIECPKDMDFNSLEVQASIERYVLKGLHHHAQRILVPRLLDFATQYGIKVGGVRIHNTQSRWGSRSTLGNVNLSAYVLLLPRHLQDYVMQHELAHFRHMNHGPQFYALLDTFCGGHHKEYQAEMRRYHTALRAWLKS